MITVWPDDRIFIAMEYLPGGNLKERMALSLGPNEALDILVQLGRPWTSCTA